MSAIKHAVEKYLLVWLTALSGFAFFADRLLPVDVFAQSASKLPWLIVVTMFAIGWMLPKDEIEQVARRWPTVFGGTAVQYVAMPMLAFLLAKWFKFEGGLFIGMMMVGCVPGAMASNVLTLMARGNTSYSVSLTTVATLVSPLVVPIALWLTLNDTDTVNPNTFLAAAIKLGWMVVLPVVSGYLISLAFPDSKQQATVVGSIIANLAILWIIAVVVAKNRDSLGQLSFRIVFALLLLNLLGYCMGLIAGKLMRLPDAMGRALTLEVGMQNAGLGTVLVVGLFPDDPLVLVPPALYTFGCMLTGSALARIWSRVGLEVQDD